MHPASSFAMSRPSLPMLCRSWAVAAVPREPPARSNVLMASPLHQDSQQRFALTGFGPRCVVCRSAQLQRPWIRPCRAAWKEAPFRVAGPAPQHVARAWSPARRRSRARRGCSRLPHSAAGGLVARLVASPMLFPKAWTLARVCATARCARCSARADFAPRRTSFVGTWAGSSTCRSGSGGTTPSKSLRVSS